MKNPRAHVELFHLLFLEQLSQKLDKRLYALKGGCNLRFFLGSIRYSEHIEIDVQTVSLNTLKNAVNKILLGVSFKQILKARNMSIKDISAPKQTMTTQRWKVQLIIPAQSLPINTKIEFSRRNLITGINTEAVLRELIVLYKVRPVFISHYKTAIALEQKIKALIFRKTTQARDIFDIYHLLQAHDTKISELFSKDELQLAIDHAMSINFSEFKSQVVSYLESQYQLQYDDPKIWNTVLSVVCENIERYIS